MDRLETETPAGPPTMSRRSMLRRSAGTAALVVAGTAVVGCAAEDAADSSPSSTASSPSSSTATTGGTSSDALFAELDEKIQAAMEQYAVPGVAVAVLHDGNEHVRGYGITSVDAPVPVDEHSLFRIGSTTKTFTGTAVMRLVDAGQLDLDATVRTYLPEFAVADEAVAAQVTLRQLLNHTPGWLGDYFQDFGRGDDALERFVASMADLPQLTPLGSTFFYNNAGLALAGRVVEKVYGTTYEQAVQDLVLDPLGLDHTRFFTDELVGNTFTGAHNVVGGEAVVEPTFWPFPRSINPSGGLISSARDQLSYLRFHLGDGTGPEGSRILSPSSLEAMHSNPGPGGTIFSEIDGYAVSFRLRPTVEGVPVVQHGGTWTGQRSGFLFVPERNFGLAMLTNSEAGDLVMEDFILEDWALSRFAGVHNPPAEPENRTAEQLAPYEGRYEAAAVVADGSTMTATIEFTAEDGELRARVVNPDGTVADDGPSNLLAFYRDDYVVLVSGSPERSDFVRDPSGEVAWFRDGGRLLRKIS
jgi:CubicO group peptidase (beta-lactamase class C family)